MIVLRDANIGGKTMNSTEVMTTQVRSDYFEAGRGGFSWGRVPPGMCKMLVIFYFLRQIVFIVFFKLKFRGHQDVFSSFATFYLAMISNL